MEIKIFKRVKRHWTAILAGAFFGFLMILPFFYFQSALGDEYKGIQREIIDDELFYMARFKDVLDGHPTLGNAYLYEHKNQPLQQLFLSEFLLARPLKFLNLDIIQGRVLYNFILTALAFLLTYTAFYLIYPSKFWANIFTVFLFFGLYLFKFTRPVIPQFVFLFWLTQFIFFWLLAKDKHYDILMYHSVSKNRLLLLNILNFGLLFYLYPFYWTFFFVFLVVLAAVFFFKDPEGVALRPYGAGKLLSKQFFKILIGGLLIGSVYFYLTFLASRLPEYQETMTRLQLVFSRSPSEIKSVALSLAVLFLMSVLYRLGKIKINRETLFFVAGLVSVLLVTNQNVVTGLKLEFGHYRMLTVFFSAFAVYYLLAFINKFQFKFIWRGIILSVIGLSVFFGVNGYLTRTLKISERDVFIQRYAAVFEWFNENTPADSVVYANEEISRLVPVYAANNVFYSRFANLFIISDEEVEERFILNNYFQKFDRDFALKNERAIWGVRYIDKYGDAVQANKWRRLLGLELKDETRLPEEEINSVLALAKEIQKDSFEKRLKKYRVDYLVRDEEKDLNWRFNKDFIVPILQSDGITVYKIN